MPAQRDTLEQTQACDARDISPLERQLQTMDSYLDYLANQVNRLEQRLSPVLSPNYFEDLGKPCPNEDTASSNSPLICEFQRYNYRVTSLNDRLGMLIEHLEI